MKSEFLKLIKNDYIHAGYEVVIGALIGYIYPIFQGQDVFNFASFKLALIGGLSLGIRKIIELWLKNSDGMFLKTENKPKEEAMFPTTDNK